MTRAFYFCCYVLLAGLIFGVACDDDDDNDGFGTSVPSSKQLSQLTDEEESQLCMDMRSGFDDVAGVNVECLMSSMIVGLGNVSRCQEAYDACVVQSNTTRTDDCEPDGSPEEDFEDCEATVGEMIKCLEDRLKASEQSFSQLEIILSCDMKMPDLTKLQGFEMPDTNPESCQTMNEKCPGWF